MQRKVVVTGIGILCPLGNELNSIWESLISGASGVRQIDTFDVSDLPVQIAGLLPKNCFSPDEYLEPKEQKKIDSFGIYALAAAVDAYKNAGWESKDVAVIIGSGIGGLQRIYETSVSLQKFGPHNGVSPFFIPSVIGNMASGLVSIKLGLNGPNYCITSACASSTHCLGEAFHQIRNGYVDYALAGGAENVICRLGIAGFASAKALSTKFNDRPQCASRPWDKDRDGFVMGEGACVLALETLESAEKRNAHIYGEIVGYGASCDAYHITSPDPNAKGAILSMKRALQDSNLRPEDIGYINAHGTSTKMGDISELQAINEIFQHDICVSSTKSSIGHLLGAAGAIEAAFSLKALETGIIPPTLNLDNPDIGDIKINLVPKVSQRKKINYAMSNSFGFGGTNGTLIFKAN